MNRRPKRSHEVAFKQFSALVTLTAVTALGGCKSSHSRPEFKPNPNAKERYEITVTVENAPGPFEVIRGGAMYQAFDCTYVSDRLAGAIAKPEWKLPIEYRQQGANTWVGTFHVDGMLDEDYDGPEGVMRPCHWQMTNATAVLLATGAEGETRFISVLDIGDALSGKPVTLYFWRQRYPRSETDNFPSFGEIDPIEFKPEIQDDLFTMTLSARRTVL